LVSFHEQLMPILFPDIVFGPISSRRFGRSLGINVLPLDNKICNFNCIYCECGWTDATHLKTPFIPFGIIAKAISERFEALHQEGAAIDHITFAGNGEPTMHPRFMEIIDTVSKERDKWLPGTPIVVLSNATLLGNKRIRKALQMADLCVLKLDAGTDHMLRLMDQPMGRQDIRWYIDKLVSFRGKVIIQTMFLRGQYAGTIIDNTTPDEVSAWLDALRKIKPLRVMLYSIDRDTPAPNLEKIPAEELMAIGQKVELLGVITEVYD
jgi:wyosine [tRNA(Phe)-imidazoG37] synthetase (radical SAM superfamily)